MVLVEEEAESDPEAGLSDVSSLGSNDIRCNFKRPVQNVNLRWHGRVEMKKRYEERQAAVRKQVEMFRREEQERLERDREAANAAPVRRDVDTQSDAGSGFSDVSAEARDPRLSLNGPHLEFDHDKAVRLLDGPDLDIGGADSDDEKVAEVPAIPPTPTRRDSNLSLGSDSAADDEDEMRKVPTVISSNDDSNRVLLQVQAVNQASGSSDCPPRPVVVRLRPDWAPTGAARFVELVEAGFYDGTRFHRVVNGALAQFGLPCEPDLFSQWKSRLLQDDAEGQAVGNSRGSLSFAEKGEHARCCQVFLNLGHNQHLNGQGFIPFAEVVQGMDVMDELCDGYGEIPPKGKGPDPELIKEEGLTYLDSKFPMLSWILEAKVLSRSGDTDIPSRRPSLKKQDTREAGSPKLEEGKKKSKSSVYFSNDPARENDSKDPSSTAGAGFKAAKMIRKTSI